MKRCHASTSDINASHTTAPDNDGTAMSHSNNRRRGSERSTQHFQNKQRSVRACMRAGSRIMPRCPRPSLDTNQPNGWPHCKTNEATEAYTAKGLRHISPAQSRRRQRRPPPWSCGQRARHLTSQCVDALPNAASPRGHRPKPSHPSATSTGRGPRARRLQPPCALGSSGNRPRAWLRRAQVVLSFAEFSLAGLARHRRLEARLGMLVTDYMGLRSSWCRGEPVICLPDLCQTYIKPKCGPTPETSSIPCPILDGPRRVPDIDSNAR